MTANIYDTEQVTFEIDYDKWPTISNKIVTAAFISILQETIQELAILGRMVDVVPTKLDLKYKPINEKYANVDFLGDKPLESCKLNNEIKFQKDRTYAELVIKHTLNNLKNEDNYHVLVEILEDYNKTLQEENRLLEETREKENELAKRKLQVEQERNHFVQRIQELSKTGGNLKDEYEDILVENELKMNYLENWENSRNELHEIQLDRAEEKYSNVTKHYNTEINREIRIHEELLSFLLETQQDYQNDIQVWMDRYDTEIEKRDNENIVLKQKIETQHEEHVKLIQIYAKHKKEAEEYKIHKEKKRLEAEEIARKINAAVRIQAWWRGTMFRKKLGPYRPKKKGKDKKGKDKKGKKKK